MSTKLASPASNKIYRTTWLVLLALTLMMLILDSSPGPRLALVAVLLVAMLIKASLIGAYFMHLRSERLALIMIVVVGLLLTGAILFALIAPDAVRIGAMTPVR